MGLLSPAMAKAGRPVVLIDGPFGDYETLVKEGHKTVNFYVNGEVTSDLLHLQFFMLTGSRKLCKEGEFWCCWMYLVTFRLPT